MTTTTKKYNDELYGILGMNNAKQKDTHPDRRGRCMIKGIWYWMSGWDKISSTGSSYSSLAFTEMTRSEVDKYITAKRESERQVPVSAYIEENQKVHSASYSHSSSTQQQINSSSDSDKQKTTKSKTKAKQQEEFEEDGIPF
ncbi:MAG: hypothetical protein EKE20_14595 [Candidatus Symbiopectobacterium sp. Dall1.0]|nr:hypothetical protein [Candidatus Symbiopectobacterium sp. Dall1.0]